MRLVKVKDGTGQVLVMATAEIRRRIAERGLRATGNAEFLTDSTVSAAGDTVTGLGYGPDYWPSVGSGSPPGSRANIGQLVRWAKAKGLANNDKAALRIAYLTSRKINRMGSKAFREGRPNVYLEVLDEFTEAGRFDQADSAEADATQFVDDTIMKLNDQRG